MKSRRTVQRPLILIVDDIPENLKVVGTILLKTEEYDVSIATKGKVAIQRARDLLPDLILLDIIMEGMDGYEVCEALKSYPPTAGIPVIFLTAQMNDTKNIVKGFEVGASDYLTKPFRKAELLARIRTHLSLKFAEEAYRSLVDNSHQGMAIIQKQQCVFSNNRMVEITGYTIKELTAMSLEDFKTIAHPDDREKVEAYFRERLMGLPATNSCQTQIITKDSKKRWVDIYAVKMKYRGIDSIQVTLIDNTREKELEILLGQRSSYRNMIGGDPVMQQIYTLIDQLAPSDMTILVTGETGTGKELASEALHRESPRSKKPLIKVNCAVLPENLIEAELFGYVKGAFTGAERDKEGFFQSAAGGTLFLDEIAEIPLNLQGKLLRAIEYKEFKPLGAVHSVRIEVRIIVATNADLQKKVEAGEFREDLWFRLKAAHIHLPPLRERNGDILMLAAHFIAKHCEEYNKSRIALNHEVSEACRSYPWPGNVRELKNMMEFGCSVCSNGMLKMSDLPPEFELDNKTNLPEAGSTGQPPSEKQKIMKVLEETRWHKVKTAERLGIARSTLYRKMKEYGIKK